MYYYKFRVYFDDVEDFVRDIEILSTDNFQSFHNVLYEAIGLKGNELSSFFICDKKWNKQKEITLIDMGDEAVTAEPEYGEEDDFSTKSDIPKTVMQNSLLKDFISDPHQQIIYEYDFLKPKVFYIELLKVQPEQTGVQYPRCSYKVKELPKEEHLTLPLSLENDFMEEPSDDFEDGYNDEDQIDLTSIEDFPEEF